MLLLVAMAHGNVEIAAALHVGEETVKTHVSRVLARLGLRDRVHAVAYAHVNGLIACSVDLALGHACPGRRSDNT